MKVRLRLAEPDLDAQRFVENNDTAARLRRVASGLALVTACLVATRTNAMVIVPTLAIGPLQLVVERLAARVSHPERLPVLNLAATQALLATAAALSGGAHSLMLPWLVLGPALAAFRLRWPTIAVVVAWTAVVLVPATTIESHHPLAPSWLAAVATLLLVVAVACAAYAHGQTEVKVRRNAMLDPLTSLLNRSSLANHFGQLAAQALLLDEPIALIVCDIDHFKSLNDRFGHPTGDAVLVDVAYVLRKSLERFERIYRLGGEEFLIVLPGVTEPDATLIAERVRTAVQTSRPAGEDVTVSAGVAAGKGPELEYETLFKLADEALYEAKEQGRNRVVGARGSEPEAVSEAIA
jgi:diguanylate cyclase (GGDEF)-like protein